VGEIDIVARDGKTLVFVEVKTRADDSPMPEDQVNPTKQHQVTKAARFYLSRYGTTEPPPARFDVVAVVWPHGRTPTIRHTTDAFEATF
jgi:putative endonuclease